VKKVFGLSLVLLALSALPLSAQAIALNVVNTSSSTLISNFSTTGSVTVTDMVSPVMTNGFLQSRIFQAQAGSPAAGKWVYEYRISLNNVVGTTYIPYVSAMSWDFGPFVGTLDYNGNGVYADHVFVITSGAIGNVGVSSASQSPGVTWVNFGSGIPGGSYPGGGQSSYFFGLVSQYAPKVGTATIHKDSGTEIVSAYVPNHP
jgi:hypothetical protein